MYVICFSCFSFWFKQYLIEHLPRKYIYILFKGLFLEVYVVICRLDQHYTVPQLKYIHCVHHLCAYKSIAPSFQTLLSLYQIIHSTALYNRNRTSHFICHHLLSILSSLFELALEPWELTGQVLVFISGFILIFENNFPWLFHDFSSPPNYFPYE